MKRIILAAIFLSIFHLPSCTLHGQNVGINTTGAAPNSSSLLDIDASPGNNKGLLIPRVSFAQRTGNFNPLPAPAPGLFIYQTDAGGFGEGFYYNTSTTTTPAWVKLFTSTTGWSLTGNAGTSGGPNFLGTTDNISLRFRTNNTQKMIIDSVGNVGIGTISPSQKLTLGTGNILLPNANDSTDGNLYFGDKTSSGKTGLRLFGGIVNAGLSAPGGYIDVRTPTKANGLYFRVDTINGGTERMRITAGGNVGVGTTSPVAKFEVSGSKPVLRVLSNTGTGFDDDNLTRFMNQDTIGEGGHIELKGAGNYQDVVMDNYFGSLRFFEPNQSRLALKTRGGYTWMTNTSLTAIPNLIQQMVLTNAGNVGIGTTTPTLNTSGKVIHVHEASTGASAIHFTNTTTGAAAANGFVMGRWNDGSYENGIILWNYAPTPITFATSATPRMYINGINGNVGIGTTTPQKTLDVNGAFRVDAPNKITQITEHFYLFSGYINGPDGWPACTDPAKIITLGTVLSGQWSPIEIEIYGTHRGYDNTNYTEYKKYVIVVGDKISAIQVASGGTSNKVGLWDGAVAGLYNNIDIGGGYNIRLQILPQCGAGMQYYYIVRYASPNFTPNATRSW